MNKKTVRDISFNKKTAVVRVDYNVPIKNGQVVDVYKIEKTLPTIQHILDHGGSAVLMSHLGRPKGMSSPEHSLKPAAETLSAMLEREVKFVSDCIGEEVEEAVRSLEPGGILLLENLRFHHEEVENNSDFAQTLASYGDIFVQDAFGVAHREHASNVAITEHIPSVAGLLLESEVETITDTLENPRSPFVAIIGGAKVSTKLDVLKTLLQKADHLIIGGAMANTFLAALQYNVGKSIYEPELIGEAQKIISEAKEKRITIGLPLDDVAVGESVDESTQRREVFATDINDNDIILDFGSASVSRVNHIIKQSSTVIWNGPIGMTELPSFAEGSLAVADAVARSEAKSLVGGGDTASFIHEYDLASNFDHISTGGGAMLELLAAKTLPAVEALDTADQQMQF